MHLNRKMQTIPELCLNFNYLLQKLYINIFEVRSPGKALQFFLSKICIFWDILSKSSVSNEKAYNDFACMESYRSHEYFGT